MHIREYLVQVAEELTGRELPRFSSSAEFQRWHRERQAQFHEMIGIRKYLQDERTPLRTRRTGTLQRDTYRVEKIYFESLPGLYVSGNLYIPASLDRPAPGIIYLCGHSLTQKVHYQDHPRRFAQLGFVTLILDTIELGEVRGVHHGTYKYGWFNWISRGYTPVGPEVWNAIRGLDLLSELDEVDENRLGITGTSGGGAMSWWTACADDRIKVVAPSCGTGTVASHVRERTIDGHCDCMFPSNPYGWSLLECYALVAPRPLLIVSPDRDSLFKIESVRLVYEKLRSFYEELGAGGDIALMEFHGPHSYSPESRRAIFSWFLKYLMGKSVKPDEVPDIDGVREEEEDLLVFRGELPPNDESTTIQDWFIPKPQPPVITSKTELEGEKGRLIKVLKRESFAAFGKAAPALEVRVEQRMLNSAESWAYQFSYQSEKEWRLWGEVRGTGDPPSPSPAVIVLRMPGDIRGERSFEILQGLDRRWLRARIDPRGTGNTAWGSELNWYLRRSAALTGRTIASMRVWDVLRGIEAVRSLPEVDSKKIALAASGEMCAIALYAALLDGEISAVILQDPPATQDSPGSPDGVGPALEVIHSLRYTDLPQVAGMLWPVRLIFVGVRPETYRWSEELYRRLGEPGGTWRVKSLGELKDLC